MKIDKVAEIQVAYYPSKISGVKINSSRDAIDILKKVWNRNTLEMQEEVKVIYLNNSNEVLGIYNLSKGSITSSLVDIRIILAVALKSISTGIILSHNHPSGSVKPSSADLSIVHKLNEACKIFDITLVDSLIITKENYVSFKDKGMI